MVATDFRQGKKRDPKKGGLKRDPPKKGGLKRDNGYFNQI